eukprot:scpid100009/ scgid13366/ S-phase kinase-associated protein 1; Cyclin-A/CDK2-associated protein p19; S-phase kinase-associated protein 1A; p19A; p19skp1 &gt; S-phase kinase-associated protein 1; Cyclin-A/CDK2-associated protein p19; S-phase kinase-associated protein 1A; p19A; p19skp1
MAPTIRLESSDRQVFVVDINVARQALEIKNQLGGCGYAEGDFLTVPLHHVNGATLSKVITWCAEQQNDVPAEEKGRALDIESWDIRTLVEVILAANYLMIERLFDEATKRVHGMRWEQIENASYEATVGENDWTREKKVSMLKSFCVI